jgi:hypothetical protein
MRLGPPLVVPPLRLGMRLGSPLVVPPLRLGMRLGSPLVVPPLGLGMRLGPPLVGAPVGLGPSLELGHLQALRIRDLVSLRLLLCSLSFLVSDGFLEFRYGRELLVGGMLLAQSGELGLADGLLLSEGGLLAKGLSTGFLLFLGQGFRLFGGDGAGSGRAVCSGRLRSSQIDFRAGGGCQRP